MKKFLTAMALGCVAVVTLAGCGGGRGSSASLETLQQTYGYQWTDTSKPILNEKGKSELSFNVYSSKNASATDYNSMEIMQTLYKQTNVRVKWTNVAESVYGTQKNTLMKKGGNYDAIYHAGLTAGEIDQNSKFNLLLPISDYLEYMPNFSKILKDRPDIKSQITSTDGKIYSLPRIEEMGLKQNPNLLFLNKAWTEKAIKGGVDIGVQENEIKEKLVDGLELNADQMKDLLTYFKNNDMNGNNKNNDEFPLTCVWENWQGNIFDLFGMFGINDNPDHRVIVDGKVTYTVLDDAYKDALDYLYGWVSSGLISPSVFDTKQNDFLTYGKSQNAKTDDEIRKGETYGAFYWWESKTVVTDPDNYICCKPLKGPQTEYGGKYKDCQTVCISNTPEIDTGELVFLADCTNPQVLLTYFDRYYDPEISAQINYGPIGIAFNEEKDENGKLVPVTLEEGQSADDLRLQNAPLGICYLNDYAWENVVNMEERATVRLERLKLYVHPYTSKDFLGKEVIPVPNLQLTTKELNTKASKETGLVSKMRSSIISWLTEKRVTANDWNAFKTELQGSKVGLNTVQKIYQDAYNRYLESSKK